MNNIFDGIFEVSGNLETTKEVIALLINMIEDADTSTRDNAALFFAANRSSINALLHVIFDYTNNAITQLDNLQNESVA